MKAKTITAKIRDAVPVCFMVNGDEMTRYRNIGIPESLKEVELRDFGFQVLADGKIEFNLHFEQGILPMVFPGIRAKVSRAEKAAAKKVMIDAETGTPITEAVASAIAEPEAMLITDEAALEPETHGPIEEPLTLHKVLPTARSKAKRTEALRKKPINHTVVSQAIVISL